MIALSFIRRILFLLAPWVLLYLAKKRKKRTQKRQSDFFQKDKTAIVEGEIVGEEK